MICFRCDNEEFKTEDSAIEQEFGGETISVVVPASFCTMCGWRTLSLSQADELFKKTLAAFAELKANGFGKPKPVIGATYTNKSTGCRAICKRIKPNGVQMKHKKKLAEQSWRTFYTFWTLATTP